MHSKKYIMIEILPQHYTLESYHCRPTNPIKIFTIKTRDAFVPDTHTVKEGGLNIVD